MISAFERWRADRAATEHITNATVVVADKVAIAEAACERPDPLASADPHMSSPGSILRLPSPVPAYM